MKVCGIIAEYNPFHNGHEYHIARTRELCNADFVIVVMSGDFVQRGIPAVCDKFSRAGAALMAGADLVIELPACYATAGADDFAKAGVMLLDKLGVVDTICFGSESGDIEMLSGYARNITALRSGISGGKSEDLETAGGSAGDRLRDCLKRGMSYPAAMQEISGQALSSNDMLAASYIAALLDIGSGIRPVAVKRIGSAYLDEKMDSDSASAIRRRLGEGMDCSGLIPGYALPAVSGENVFADDLSDLLYMKLVSERQSGRLTRFVDVSETIEGAVIKNLDKYISVSQFADMIASKNYTRGRVMRALIHVLLDITDEDVRTYKDNGMIGYARILGMRRDSADVLTAVKENGKVPVIAKAADAMNVLKSPFDRMFMLDVQASNLYNYVFASKNHINRTHEFSKVIKCI